MTVQSSHTLQKSGYLNRWLVVRDFHSLMEKSSVEFERSRISSRKLKTLPKDYLPTDGHHWPVNALQPSCWWGESSVAMFRTELNPHWPEKLHARESESKLKQQSNFNFRHKATPLTPLEPDTEVHVRDLDWPGVVMKAAETPRSHEVKTPISTVRRNRVHLTPMPEQRENQPVPAEDKIAAPVEADQPKL